MQPVGHPAFAVFECQQARTRALDQWLQHRQYATGVPALVRRLKAVHRPLPHTVIVGQREEIPQTQAEKLGHQRRPGALRIRRRGDGFQHPQHLRGLIAVEYAALVQARRGNPRTCQSRLEPRSLGIGVDQHAEIPGREHPGIVVFPHPGAPLPIEQMDDLAHGGIGELFARLLGGKRLVGVLGSAGLQRPERQCRQRLAFQLDHPVVVFAPGLNRHELDCGQHERPLGRLGEQRFHRLQNAGRGAVVGIETVLPLCITGRVQVGEYIAAAKAVDRLFRIADHDHSDALMAVINGLQNRVLQRVGILKFIDQRPRPAATQRLGECRPLLRVGHRLMQRLDHVVETVAAAFTLAPLHGDPHGVRRVADHRQTFQTRGRQQGIHRLGQVCWHPGFLRATLDLPRQAIAGKQYQRFGNANPVLR